MCLYVSGVPGTGKTATLRSIMDTYNHHSNSNSNSQSQSSSGSTMNMNNNNNNVCGGGNVICVEVNGMGISDPAYAYSMVWRALTGEQVSSMHALDLLNSYFSSTTSSATANLTGAQNSSGSSSSLKKNGRRLIGNKNRKNRKNGSSLCDSGDRPMLIVLLDELDLILSTSSTHSQTVIYNFFNWPTLPHSRLVVIGVANTMDLPERSFSNKVSSRMGLVRVQFYPYSVQGVCDIIKYHYECKNNSSVNESSCTILNNGNSNKKKRICESTANSNNSDSNSNNQLHRRRVVFTEDAVELCARKVSAVSGDARRALDICKRASEIAMSHHTSTSSKNKKKRTSNEEEVEVEMIEVGVKTVNAAIMEMLQTSSVEYIKRSLSLHQKIFLVSLLCLFRATGLAEAEFGDVVEHHLSLFAQHFHLISSTTSSTSSSELETPSSTSAAAVGKKRFAPSRSTLFEICSSLGDSRILSVQTCTGSSAPSMQKLRLGIVEEDVLIALKTDPSVMGLVDVVLKF